MPNQDWENERLYVLETVKDLRDRLRSLDESFSGFKTDVKTALATIQTKLAMYALVGSGVVTAVINSIWPR